MHKITKEKMIQLRDNRISAEKAGQDIKNPTVETFDAEEVGELLKQPSVSRIGVVMGLHDEGRGCSMLVAYDKDYNLIDGVILEFGYPCPPPPCS